MKKKSHTPTIKHRIMGVLLIFIGLITLPLPFLPSTIIIATGVAVFGGKEVGEALSDIRKAERTETRQERQSHQWTTILLSTQTTVKDVQQKVS